MYDHIEQAFLRMELVEHIATVAHHAQSMGGVRVLPEHMLAPLVAKHVSAGLAAPNVHSRGAGAYEQNLSKQVQSQLSRMPTNVSGDDLASLVSAVTKQTLQDLKGEK